MKAICSPAVWGVPSPLIALSRDQFAAIFKCLRHALESGELCIPAAIADGAIR